MLTMIFSLDDEQLSEHFPEVWRTWFGVLMFGFFYEVGDALFGMKKEARAVSDAGVAAGRHQERVKARYQLTEDELQTLLKEAENNVDNLLRPSRARRVSHSPPKI